MGIDFGHSNRGAVPKWPKGMVCKTIIRRFESDPRLQFSRYTLAGFLIGMWRNLACTANTTGPAYKVTLLTPLF